MGEILKRYSRIKIAFTATNKNSLRTSYNPQQFTIYFQSQKEEREKFYHVLKSTHTKKKKEKRNNLFLKDRKTFRCSLFYDVSFKKITQKNLNNKKVLDTNGNKNIRKKLIFKFFLFSFFLRDVRPRFVIKVKIS